MSTSKFILHATRALAGAAVALAAFGASAQDIAAGEQRAAMCIGCHGIPGYQASFPEVHKVPMISGQNAKYIAAALTAYQKGERNHPTMRAIASPLTEKEIADLAAFYEQHVRKSMVQPVADKPAAQPSAEVAALLAKGACASCHGENFNKPIDPAYPKLAGQHPDYLYVALKSYPVQGRAAIGRSNPIMGGQVKQFSHRELKALADYIGSLPGDLQTVRQNPFR